MTPEKISTPNWQKIHDRLEQARTINSQDFAASPEKKQQILKKRAKTLARVINEQREAKSYLDVTTFLLSGINYAAELIHIRDVFPLKDITPIPCTPPFMAGIVNVRGQILPVIDLKKFFGLPSQSQTRLKQIIILSAGGTELGILIDTIGGIRSIPVTDIQPPLLASTDGRSEYVKGLTIEPLIIIDPLKILADQRLVVNEEVE